MSRLKRCLRELLGRSAPAKDNAAGAKKINKGPTPMENGVQFCRDTAFPVAPGRADCHPETVNPLWSYFDAHREGAGLWKWTHYFDIYQRHFSKFVGREIHLLEVGVYSGGSLPMWKEYFGAGCHIYGVDIEEACMAYEQNGTRIFIGDQADRQFWSKIKQAVPRIDILIDDGGHKPEQQRITLEEMLPHIQPGGVYLCEDIHGDTNKFAAYLQGLAASLHSMGPAQMPPGVSGIASAATQFQQAIGGIHLYPFVAVIEKREANLPQFMAPKHGTQWQPFLS